VIITKAQQGRAQAAEAKEIDNRGMGEYHGPYFFSRLRSVKAHEEPGLLAGCWKTPIYHSTGSWPWARSKGGVAQPKAGKPHRHRKVTT